MNKKLKKLVKKEINRSRRKNPRNNERVLKFNEEAGETFKACMKFSVGKKSRQHVREELIQAIAQAVRLWEEGDSYFKIRRFIK